MTKTQRIFNKYILLLMFLHESQVLGQSAVSVVERKNKAIKRKFMIRELKMGGQSFGFCLARCLEDCFCRSFQVCDGNACELSSLDRRDNKKAFQNRLGCVYYELDYENRNDEQCGSACTRSINCCMTSNPCLNGGGCLPASRVSTKSRSRFFCKCAQPFTGPRCGQPIKSCRGYRNGSRTPGLYKILDGTRSILQVYCDFDKITSLTWTLVQSHLRDTRMTSLVEDASLSTNTPSWSGYRLDRTRMLSIQGESTKWRITCQYDGATPLSDYMYGATQDLDILTSIVGCGKVEHIQIRGESCSNCSVYFFQNNNNILHFFSANAESCDFVLSDGAKVSCKNNRLGGDYFGDFSCVDEAHACSASPNATTQTWFGGD